MRGGLVCFASLALLTACGGGGDDRNSASGSGDSGITTLPADGSGTTGVDPTASGGSGEPKLDNPVETDLGAGNCGGDGGNASGGGGMDDDGDGEIDFSYIWIANSVEGTISKIDTQTLVEEGRYIVRPDSNGNPSRTSLTCTS